MMSVRPLLKMQILYRYKNQLVWSLRNVFPNSSSSLTAHIQKFSPKFSQNILQNLHTEGYTQKFLDFRFLFQHWTITITHHWWIRINRTYQNDHWTYWLKPPDSPVPDQMHRPALNLTCINGINKLQITSIRLKCKNVLVRNIFGMKSHLKNY